MECVNCGMEFDEEFQDDCPYCGSSADAVICPECGSPVDDDITCSVCGYMLHDPYEGYYAESSIDIDDDEEEDSDFDEEYGGDETCADCTYWQAHPLGSAYGMICQKTGANTDPDDSCSYFVKMFHSSNYGDEGQFSFTDTEQEKKRKLDMWQNRRF